MNPENEEKKIKGCFLSLQEVWIALTFIHSFLAYLPTVLMSNFLFSGFRDRKRI